MWDKMAKLSMINVTKVLHFFSRRTIIPSLTLLKIKNAHKERGCALCEHFLFGFNVCYIFFTVILIFLSSLSLLA
jgi:hypothetical protein